MKGSLMGHQAGTVFWGVDPILLLCNIYNWELSSHLFSKPLNVVNIFLNFLRIFDKKSSIVHKRQKPQHIRSLALQ